MHLKQDKRNTIDATQVSQLNINTEAELGYAIMRLIQGYQMGNPSRFQSAVGVIEGVKHEVFRKHIHPATVQAEFDHGEL